MAKFTLTIALDNAAFHDSEGTPEPHSEVGRILTALGERVAASTIRTEFPLLDYNGNTVGVAKFTDEEVAQ